VVRFLQDINAGQQADAQFDGVGEARRFSGVYDFTLAKDRCSAKW
jgi:hypothetical protein